MLGLLSKTVTATLPAALLVVFWWQRGRLSWRRDVLPLVPFFLLGAAAGLLTAWVERKLIGAEGAAFELTVVERCLIAGRAVWFYLGSSFGPADLIFIYPRWQIEPGRRVAISVPRLASASAGRCCGCCGGGGAGRWPAMLFFVGTLLPVLGFFNVYPFVFSFVADHFQYLASLGVISLARPARPYCSSAGGVARPGGYALCLGLLAVLGVLTFRQSQMYADAEKLYRRTIDGNPTCWMAHCNLGAYLVERGRHGEAIAEFQNALDIKPDYAQAHNNLGSAVYRRRDR